MDRCRRCHTELPRAGASPKLTLKKSTLDWFLHPEGFPEEDLADNYVRHVVEVGEERCITGASKQVDPLHKVRCGSGPRLGGQVRDKEAVQFLFSRVTVRHQLIFGPYAAIGGHRRL